MLAHPPLFVNETQRYQKPYQVYCFITRPKPNLRTNCGQILQTKKAPKGLFS